MLFRSQLRAVIPFSADCEITLEANSGTLEHEPFEGYLAAGINRLSLGVQTFDDERLKVLGRVHSAADAMRSIRQAKQAGFARVNVDLMHGLPEQTVAQAVYDLQTAIDCGATHISWYQLTIEPNTVFFRTQPVLPDEDRLAEIQAAGEAVLRAAGFRQYEVSAWAKEQPCRHNLNYWQFGDYLAAGAGAPEPSGWDEAQRETLRERIAARQPFIDFSFSRVNVDGSRQVFRVSGEPMFNESCRYIGYRGIGVEVTAGA